jgi:hypothetical protein
VSAHTPGPWRYYTGKLRTQFPTIIHEIQSARGKAIVKWGGFDGVEGPSREIAANARLMAAAPRLADALAGLIGLVELVIPTLKESQRAGMKFNPRLDEARAALAAARSRRPRVANPPAKEPT